MKTATNPDELAEEDAGRRIAAWDAEVGALLEADKLTPELNAQLRAKYFPEPLPASSPFPEVAMNTRARFILFVGAAVIALILIASSIKVPIYPQPRAAHVTRTVLIVAAIAVLDLGLFTFAGRDK